MEIMRVMETEHLKNTTGAVWPLLCLGADRNPALWASLVTRHFTPRSNLNTLHRYIINRRRIMFVKKGSIAAECRHCHSIQRSAIGQIRILMIAVVYIHAAIDVSVASAVNVGARSAQIGNDDNRPVPARLAAHYHPADRRIMQIN